MKETELSVFKWLTQKINDRTRVWTKAFQCPKSQNLFFLPSLLPPFLLSLLSHSWCFSKIQNWPKITSLPLQKLGFSIMGDILYSGNQQILYRSHEKWVPFCITVIHYFIWTTLHFLYAPQALFISWEQKFILLKQKFHFKRKLIII